MVTANNQVEVFIRGDSAGALDYRIGYIDLTLNRSSGAGRTTCRFTASGQALRAASIAGANIIVVGGGDTLLFDGEIQTIDLNLGLSLIHISEPT